MDNEPDNLQETPTGDTDNSTEAVNTDDNEDISSLVAALEDASNEASDPIAEDDEADESGENDEAEISEENKEPELSEDEIAAEKVRILAACEAVLFAAENPIKTPKVAKAIGAKTPDTKKAIVELAKSYEERNSGLEIRAIAGAWQIFTRADYADNIRKMRRAVETRRLSKPALETLAIIAYRQPILKQEIEDIRGVGCGPVLSDLANDDLIDSTRSDKLGNPLIYSTTNKFLELIGIDKLDDLPNASEIARDAD